MKSERAKLIKKCEDLIRKQKFKLFGRKCQFCKHTTQLGLFHILSKGAYPRIRLHEDNLLIACWLPCHHGWHHNFYYARDTILPKIAKLLGNDWEDMLNELNRTEPPLKLQRIKDIHEELKQKAE